MSFNWWKRHEVKPQPKSHFPIKVKIEEAPSTVPGNDECSGEASGDLKKTEAGNKPEEAGDCMRNEGEGL